MDILTNKIYRNDYNYSSRYTNFPVYYNTVDKRNMCGITSNLKTDTNIGVIEHIVEIGDTLDSLAYKYYGRPDLFWIIADYNRIKDSLIVLSDYYKTLIIPSMVNIEFE